MGSNQGATIDISVGNGGIKFSPNTATAAVGDTLAFHFYEGSGPHSVVRSSFDNPCMPMAGTAEFYSGYFVGDTAGTQTYEITVTDTEPIWYYCSAEEHCENGMVGVINPPSNSTVEEYAAAAKSVSAPAAPSAPIGGTSTSIAAMTGSSSSVSMTTGSATSTGAVASATSQAASASSVVSSAVASATSAKAGSANSVSAGKTVAGLAIVAGGLVALMA